MSQAPKVRRPEFKRARAYRRRARKRWTMNRVLNAVVASIYTAPVHSMFAPPSPFLSEFKKNRTPTRSTEWRYGAYNLNV